MYHPKPLQSIPTHSHPLPRASTSQKKTNGQVYPRSHALRYPHDQDRAILPIGPITRSPAAKVQDYSTRGPQSKRADWTDDTLTQTREIWLRGERRGGGQADKGRRCLSSSSLRGNRPLLRPWPHRERKPTASRTRQVTCTRFAFLPAVRMTNVYATRSIFFSDF